MRYTRGIGGKTVNGNRRRECLCHLAATKVIMHRFVEFAGSQLKHIESFIRDLVVCESPSDSPVDVNRLVDLLADTARDIAKVKTVRAPGVGGHLLLEFKIGARKTTGRILGLGHSDTVWPIGTLAAMPFRKHGGRLWGPGVLDMKAGLAFFLYAIRMLQELDVPLRRKLALLIVSDEEIGSLTSRTLTETEAKRSDYVLVVEPGTGLTGKLKTARKGIGRYQIRVQGRASHAGVDFEKGASAILEAARQVEKCAGFTDLRRGITVNPGVIRGGTRSNVVAAEAEIEVDVRVVRMTDAGRIDKRMRALRPFDKRCQVQVDGGLNRPPMERTAAIAALFRKSRDIGSQLGIALEESSTGGGSDGNFTAALGVPTLDGLGAVGEGAHAANESILVDRIAERTALLAGLLAGL
jgi:glutamate carboxypeptidase